MIAQCLSAATQDKKEFAGSCIGIIADPCISAAYNRNSGEEEAKACAARELAVWAERMQTALKTVNRNGFPGFHTTLVTAQKEWLISREKLCSLFRNLDPGVNMGGSDYCRLQETGRRDLILERLGAAVSEH
jgi:hypothetical protein